jgi:hypothetical protein
MNTLCLRFITIISAGVFVLLMARLAIAVEKRDARITQIVREVHVLTSRAASRPASVNEMVGEGTAVRTGGESRAELTFRDASLTRLGANTVFSFEQGARTLDLTSGAVLICVPPESPGVRVNTPAVSAAITGGIAMVETHKNSWIKVIIIEGQGVLTLKSSGETLTLTAGQIIALPPGARHFTKAENIDVKKLTDNSVLVHFAKLPAWVWTLIEAEIERQQNFPVSGGGGLKDPTGFNAIDQRAATTLSSPPPKPSPRPTGAPASTLRGKP